MKTFCPSLISCMRSYSKAQFVKDLVSGVIVAIIALPLSIALALASGVFYAGIFFTSRLPGADSLQSTILGNLMYVFFIPLLFTDEALMNPASTGMPAWQAWVAIFFMGSCQLGLSWICFSRGIKTTPSLQASFITMIEPVGSAILA